MTIKCKPKHDQHGRTCAISIQNYGIGIEADERSRVREPLYRGRLAMKEVPVGTGLGLSDAHGVATAHGGYLRIKSERLHGNIYLTTVEIILQAHRSAT